jgi:hypothetical protein
VSRRSGGTAERPAIVGDPFEAAEGFFSFAFGKLVGNSEDESRMEVLDEALHAFL